MTLREDPSQVRHSNPPPVDPLDPDAYQVPGITDQDRAEFDALVQACSRVDGAEVGRRGRDEVTGDLWPQPLLMAMHFHHTDDLADFEQRWYLYRQERGGRALRRELRRSWGDLRSRMMLPPGEQKTAEDPQQHLLASGVRHGGVRPAR